ncbi:MAG: family efflux transporter, subunit [Pedosphaera sp.]|nr:family efflux transporter, subunit [Pedosphaera sp.]
MNLTEPNPPASIGSSAPEPRTAAGNSAQPKLGRWALLVLVLLALGAIAGLVPRWHHRRALANETRTMAIPTVNVVSALPGKATSMLTLPAEVKAVVEAPIYARASGFLKRWYVDIGARVEAGQLLADIDTPELEQELSGARAGLAQAEAALALAKTTAVRWAELLKTASVSEQEDAEKQADLALKAANVDAAKANVHRFEDLQSFTHVTAPFAGVLTTRRVDVGDLISSGKELFRLADTRTLRVFVRVPQSATPSIKSGVAAEMILPEMPARKFAAKVVRTAGAIDVNSRTLLTELEVDNSRNEILAGSYAQVSFGDLRLDPTLVLPSNSLLFRAEGLQVGVVGPDGRVELHNITLGRDFGRSVEVLSGITAADRVVVNPSDSLVSGVTVSVAEAAQAENAK